MLAAVTLAGVPGHGNWPRLMIFAAADIAMLFWKKDDRQEKKKTGFLL